MGTFTLDSSRLGGGQYRTQSFDMNGEFREIQVSLSQSGQSQDMESHGLEVHYTIAGVSKEVSS